MPGRITLSRAKGWRMPENTVKVDRGTMWGNPFKVADHGRGVHAQDIAKCLFRCWIEQPQQSRLVDAARRDLRGKNLACWCKQGTPCHADILLEIANQ